MNSSGDDVDLVVTDLDGTLWHTPDYTPEVTRDAVAELARRGVPLLVATGRRLGSTRRPLAELGLSPPAVMLNGGLGVDLQTNTSFHRGGFDVDDAVAVLAAFTDRGVEPCVYVDSVEPSVRIGERPSSHPRHLAGFGPDAKVADLAEVVAEEPVLSFSVLGLEQELADELTTALSRLAVPHNAPDRQYGGQSVTVAPNNVSKWDGIVSFCHREGLDQSRTLVLGDGPNDIEMLDMAAVAVVPSDGHEEALARADHVIEPARIGGWAQVLDLL